MGAQKMTALMKPLSSVWQGRNMSGRLKTLTSFFVFSTEAGYILIFLPNLGWKCSREIFLYKSLWQICFLTYLVSGCYLNNFRADMCQGIEYTSIVVFVVFDWFWRLEKEGIFTVQLKTYNCIVFTNFQHTKMIFFCSGRQYNKMHLC